MKNIKVIIAKSFWQKLLGLIIYSKFPENSIMLIKKCKSIHTFFMRFKIDVIFVDKGNRIVKLKENLSPWRICIGGIRARDVYEAPSGFIKKYNLQNNNIFFITNYK